jgi:hypothetical protein
VVALVPNRGGHVIMNNTITTEPSPAHSAATRLATLLENQREEQRLAKDELVDLQVANIYLCSRASEEEGCFRVVGSFCRHKWCHFSSIANRSEYVRSEPSFAHHLTLGNYGLFYPHVDRTLVRLIRLRTSSFILTFNLSFFVGGGTPDSHGHGRALLRRPIDSFWKSHGRGYGRTNLMNQTNKGEGSSNQTAFRNNGNTPDTLTPSPWYFIDMKELQKAYDRWCKGQPALGALLAELLKSNSSAKRAVMIAVSNVMHLLAGNQSALPTLGYHELLKAHGEVVNHLGGSAPDYARFDQGDSMQRMECLIDLTFYAEIQKTPQPPQAALSTLLHDLHMLVFAMMEAFSRRARKSPEAPAKLPARILKHSFIKEVIGGVVNYTGLCDQSQLDSLVDAFKREQPPLCAALERQFNDQIPVEANRWAVFASLWKAASIVYGASPMITPEDIDKAGEQLAPAAEGEGARTAVGANFVHFIVMPVDGPAATQELKDRYRKACRLFSTSVDVGFKRLGQQLVIRPEADGMAGLS